MAVRCGGCLSRFRGQIKLVGLNLHQQSENIVPRRNVFAPLVISYPKSQNGLSSADLLNQNEFVPYRTLGGGRLLGREG